MNDTFKKNMNKLQEELDELGDRLHLTNKKEDGQEMDRIARDLILLGQVIKDAAYEMGREIRG